MLVSAIQRPLSTVRFIVRLRLVDTSMSVQQLQNIWWLLGGHAWTFPGGFFASGNFEGHVPADDFHPSRRSIEIGDVFIIEGIFLDYSSPDQRIIDATWDIFEKRAQLTVDYFMGEAYTLDMDDSYFEAMSQPLQFVSQPDDLDWIGNLSTTTRQYGQPAAV